MAGDIIQDKGEERRKTKASGWATAKAAFQCSLNMDAMTLPALLRERCYSERCNERQPETQQLPGASTSSSDIVVKWKLPSRRQAHFVVANVIKDVLAEKFVVARRSLATASFSTGIFEHDALALAVTQI